MIEVFEPTCTKRLGDLKAYKLFLSDQISNLPKNMSKLSIHAGADYFTDSSNEISQSLYNWESRNRLIMHRFLMQFDITEFISDYLFPFAQDYYHSEVMISQIVYIRSETPCNLFHALRPHHDDFGLSMLTFWLPLHDISRSTGGICFKTDELPTQLMTKCVPLANGEADGFLLPYLMFGQCIVFDSSVLHASTTSSQVPRSSIDIRLAPKDEAMQYNTRLKSDYNVNDRGRYIPLGFSSASSFRTEQLRHLNRMKTLERMIEF